MAGRKTILLVEDEFVLALALAADVKAAGYDVAGPCGSLDEAQALMNEHGIDAALLDIRLRDGGLSFELAERLAAQRIPFAFVTAYSSYLFPIAFSNAPVLNKPVTAGAIADMLKRLLPS